MTVARSVHARPDERRAVVCASRATRRRDGRRHDRPRRGVEPAGVPRGDLVVAAGGWQDYALSDGSDLIPLGRDFPHPSRALGVLGMPGFTAYTGPLTIGEPKAGETVVVAAASGVVGAVVGQIAKLKGCRVIGVAGGADKCAYVTGTLGFDACIDHRDPAFASQLKAACPNGIDVYFENVGGAVFDAVWPLLNNHARVPVCGLIAHYNDTALPAGPDRLPKLMTTILSKRIRMQGFIILDYYATGYAPFEGHERMGRAGQREGARGRDPRPDRRAGRTDRPARRQEFRQGRRARRP